MLPVELSSFAEDLKGALSDPQKSKGDVGSPDYLEPSARASVRSEQQTASQQASAEYQTLSSTQINPKVTDLQGQGLASRIGSNPGPLPSPYVGPPSLNYTSRHAGMYERLERFERLDRFERLKRLEQLERLERPEAVEPICTSAETRPFLHLGGCSPSETELSAPPLFLPSPPDSRQASVSALDLDGSATSLRIKITVPEWLKRKRERQELEDGDMDRSDRRRNKRARFLETNPGVEAAVEAGGGGGDDGAGPDGVFPIHLWGPDCQRNSVPAASSRKQASRSEFNTEQETALIETSKGQEVLEALVMGSTFDLQAEETTSFIAHICSILRGQPWDPSDSFRQDSLYNLTQRVHRCAAIQSAVDFTYMVTLMQLSAKDVSLRLALTESTQRVAGTATVWKAHLSQYETPALKTYCSWVKDGYKFAALCSAGSIYFLLLIAGRKLLHTIKSMTVGQIKHLSDIIRCPKSDLLSGRLVQKLIPYIEHLMGLLPLEMTSMFGLDLRLKYNIPDKIHCHNLRASTRLFNIIRGKGDFTLVPRLDAVWESCQKAYDNTVAINVQSSTSFFESSRAVLSSSGTLSGDGDYPYDSPLSPMSYDEGLEDNFDIDDFSAPAVPPWSNPETISTKLDLKNKQNRRLPWLDHPDYKTALKLRTQDQRHFAKKLARLKWGQAEEILATKAKRCDTLQAFKKKLNNHITDKGVKRPRAYLKVGRGVFEGSEIRVNNADNSVQVVINSNCPKERYEDLAEMITDSYRSVGGITLEHRDTSDPNDDGVYHTSHFRFYCKYGPRGENVPEDAHPNNVTRKGKMKLNISQVMPCGSKEIEEDSELYERLSNAFGPLFEHTAETVARCLNEEYLELEMAAQALPSGEMVPCHPFTGFVVNINVKSRAHRDVGDLKICVVIVLGDHEGGELVLVEPGLVLELKSGDIVIFPSGDITHFNLDYKGVRASIVLNTDKAMKSYQEDMRGWKDNKHFIPVEALSDLEESDTN